MLSMTRLTSVNGTFGAHVLAARLADEGFDVELRGPGFGPYGGGLTIGDMARVDVYLPSDQIDEASFVLLATEVDNLLDDDLRPRHSPILRVLAAGVLLLVVVCGLMGGRTLF